MTLTPDTLKIVFLGIIQGITEWLPISSTGHMILFDHYFPTGLSDHFMNMFMIFIQIGSVLAVILLFIRTLNPYHSSHTPDHRKHAFILWAKIAFASIPAAVIGLLFDDIIDLYLFKPEIIAMTLILYGVLFIYTERQEHEPSITHIHDISYKDAFMIGIFQTFAVIPGTSRSGATILGALWLGASRPVAAEFSFFLSIPVLFGYGMVKFIKAGFGWSSTEWALLSIGFITAFVVSVLAIRVLMAFVKRHRFTSFAYYRIALGIFVLITLVILK